MTYSVKQIRERYGVGDHTVLGWIRHGELVAINVSRRPGGKPKWRITPDALTAFEQLRTAMPRPRETPRRRRQQVNMVKFY